MGGGTESVTHVNKTLYKNAVDQALAYLLSPLAHRVVDILKNTTEDWWEKKVCNNSKVRENLHSPSSSEEEDRIGVLQISSCCELVFADIGRFHEKWGDRCRGLISLVKEARNESSHRPVKEPDLTQEDAEFYLYAIYQAGEMIKADPEVVETLRWMHECVWLGQVPSFPPVDVGGCGDEPTVSDVVPFEGVSRWFDDQELRERVGSLMEGFSEEDVLGDFKRRLDDEVSLANPGWLGWVSTYPDSTGGIVDEPVPTLVFLPCTWAAPARGRADPAIVTADRIMASSTKGPRVNRNMLFFVDPEPAAYDRMRRSIKECLALHRLMEEGVGGQKMVQFVADADADTRRRMREAYSEILVPESGWGMYQPLYRRLGLKGGNIIEETVRALSASGLLYVSERVVGDGVSRFRLSDLGWPRHAESDVQSIRSIWETLSKGTDYPIIESSDILRHAIWCDVRDGYYGYADDARVEYSTAPRPGWRPGRLETPDGVEFVYPYPVCEGLWFEEEIPDVRMDGFVVTPEAVYLNGRVSRWTVTIPAPSGLRDPASKSKGEVGDDERRCRRAAV